MNLKKASFGCCRVIALAYKKLDAKLSPVEIGNLPRSEVESNLHFGAFAIFQCPLKEESEPALRMLKVPLTFSLDGLVFATLLRLTLGITALHVVMRYDDWMAVQDASHQLVMITGDAPLTACHAASQVHILDRPVLMLVHRYPSCDSFLTCCTVPHHHCSPIS